MKATRERPPERLTRHVERARVRFLETNAAEATARREACETMLAEVTARIDALLDDLAAWGPDPDGGVEDDLRDAATQAEGLEERLVELVRAERVALRNADHAALAAAGIIRGDPVPVPVPDERVA